MFGKILRRHRSSESTQEAPLTASEVILLEYLEDKGVVEAFHVTRHINSETDEYRGGMMSLYEAAIKRRLILWHASDCVSITNHGLNQLGNHRASRQEDTVTETT